MCVVSADAVHRSYIYSYSRSVAIVGALTVTLDTSLNFFFPVVIRSTEYFVPGTKYGVLRILLRSTSYYSKYFTTAVLSTPCSPRAVQNHEGRDILQSTSTAVQQH